MFNSSNIVDNRDQLVELIRQLSEFIMFGQKYGRDEYFQDFLSLETPGKLAEIHSNHVFEINQQILQTVNILVLNLQDKAKSRKWFLFGVIAFDSLFAFKSRDYLPSFFLNSST